VTGLGWCVSDVVVNDAQRGVGGRVKGDGGSVGGWLYSVSMPRPFTSGYMWWVEFTHALCANVFILMWLTCGMRYPVSCGMQHHVSWRR
jgi:hypothetical protein